MHSHARETGGILLVALVLLAVIIIFLSAVSGLIITQRHTLAENLRTTQAFHLADAGLAHFTSLVNKGQCTLPRLTSQTIRQKLVDPETQEVVGTYALRVSKDKEKFIATSIGETASPARCQAVTVTLTEQPGRYLMFWRSDGVVTCPSPIPLTPPLCG